VFHRKSLNSMCRPIHPPLGYIASILSHMDFTWIHGPPERLNRLKSMCTPGIKLRANMIATPRKHTLRGAHLGSASPWISQTDLGSADRGPPRGSCLLVLEVVPEVFHSS
jgi:hypothetical protein